MRTLSISGLQGLHSKDALQTTSIGKCRCKSMETHLLSAHLQDWLTSLENGRIIATLCQRYAKALPHPKIPQLYLYGPGGRGKSFMGNAIAADAIEQGIDALRLTAYRMIEEVMEGFSTNTSPLSRFTSVPLLVLDDLGTEPMIPNVTAESLFAIADQRNSSRLATVYISNLDQDELATRYQERIASRITDASITKAIYFKGGSLRGIKEKNH